MTPTLAHQIDSRVQQARQLYHRLVLVVGPANAGKTSALRELHTERGWPLLNINLRLSERLLELTTRQRALRVARLVDDIVAEENADPVMLDNLEMLFHPDLQQDPLGLLKSLTRNRTVVAAWRGILERGSLIYATPDHPEFRRFDDPQTLIVEATSTLSAGHGTAPAQDHSA